MNIVVMTILALIIGGILEALLLFFLLNMLRENEAVGTNYLGHKIPVSAGISFPVTVMLVFLLFVLFGYYDNSYTLFLLGITFMSFLGFIDDMLGKRDVTGLKGHFTAMCKGRLTTGGLKALGGGVVALFLAVLNSADIVDVIINALIIALFTNMLNLLDLRPGRAIKGYILFLLLMGISGINGANLLMIAPLTGAILYYFAIDLKGGAMMGDAGSNVLGLTLGYLTVVTFSMVPRIIILFVLLGIHVYTEKYSLSRTIEKIGILRYLDDLGRG